MYSYSTIQRRARAIGLTIRKGCLHFQESICHDYNGDQIPGYVIEDQKTGFWIWGSHDDNFSYCLSMEDIVEQLKDAYEARGLNW